MTVIDKKTPELKRYRELPAGMATQVEAAVKDFIESSHPCKGVDSEGYYYQTLETMANGLLSGVGEFWMVIEEGKLLGYVLAHVSKDIDNRLTYWVTEAWVHPEWRGNPIVKEWATVLWQRAKDCFCKHILIISSRGEAYVRWFDDGWDVYAKLLKKDL